MDTNHPSKHLVTLIILAFTVSSSSGMAIPNVQPVSKLSISDTGGVETEQDTGNTDYRPLIVLKEDTEADSVMLTEFYRDEESGNVQPTKNDDSGRYFYEIINSQKESGRRLNDTENLMVTKTTKEDQNPVTNEEDIDTVPQWTLLRQRPQIEDNVPGFHNLPKHIPDHLRPISPFPEVEAVTEKGRGFIREKHENGDGLFVPSETFIPPPRAGPYLYPQSIADREFRVPIY